jgi:hypothetical protein
MEVRKEIREEAWQVDGWAETVSKVEILNRARCSVFHFPADGSIDANYGFLHPCTVAVQPTEVMGE